MATGTTLLPIGSATPAWSASTSWAGRSRRSHAAANPLGPNASITSRREIQSASPLPPRRRFDGTGSANPRGLKLVTFRQVNFKKARSSPPSQSSWRISESSPEHGRDSSLRILPFPDKEQGTRNDRGHALRSRGRLRSTNGTTVYAVGIGDDDVTGRYVDNPAVSQT